MSHSADLVSIYEVLYEIFEECQSLDILSQKEVSVISYHIKNTLFLCQGNLHDVFVTDSIKRLISKLEEFNIKNDKLQNFLN